MIVNFAKLGRVGKGKLVLLTIVKKGLHNFPKRCIERTKQAHDIQKTVNENMRKFVPFSTILGPIFSETTLPNGGDDLNALHFFNLYFTDSLKTF